MSTLAAPYDINSGTSGGGRLAKIPPTRFLLVAAIFSVVCFALSLHWAMHVPWLGVTFSPDPKGIRVAVVVPQGPSDGLLVVGDLLVGLRNGGTLLPLSGDSLLREQQLFPTFNQAKEFKVQQEDLFAAISNGVATFVHADGREIRVNAFGTRPIRDLTTGFWAMSATSIAILFVGAGVWAYTRARTATRLVALSSVAYMIAGLSLAVYGTREWVLEPRLFEFLTASHSFGNMVANFWLVILLWYYPRPLGNFPMFSLLSPMVGLVWVNNQFFQWFELPWHAYRMPCFASIGLAIWFARRQWIATQQHPVDRAALLWILLSLALSVGLLIANYMVPYLYSEKPIVAFWVCQVRILPLYIGLILGIRRFHLFELDSWWFSIWSWFLAGVLVVLVDVVLVYSAHVEPAGALTLSLLVLGWVYFPIRQWAWSKFVRSPSESLEAYLPKLLDTFFGESHGQALRDRWKALLSQIFEPLHVQAVRQPLEQVRPEDDGLALAVPDIEEEGHLLLSGRTRGSRLFTRDDVRLASFILTLARKSTNFLEAQKRGATVERERIARDLHDDVAPKLLTLVHRATTRENAEYARSALQTLRESIYTLSEPRELPLDAVIAEWRVEASERTEAAGVSLQWCQPEEIPALQLNARQRLNLGRVLREAITNALRHARPKKIEIAVGLTSQHLSMSVIHHGQSSTPESWQPGKGISNMRTRIRELNGHICWQPTDSPQFGVKVSWELPLLLSADVPA